MRIGILGFGEAGRYFARHLVQVGATVCAFDVLLDDAATAPKCRKCMADAGVEWTASAASLAPRSDLIISTVTAQNAVDACESLGEMAGQCVLDLNSVGPATKLRIANLVSQRGATCVTGVAMDTVPQKGARVPLLLSGPDADRLTDVLNDFGLNARYVGADHGLAAQIKLTRSVFIKGFEAVFAEAVAVAHPLGIWDEVCASLDDTFPGMDWAQVVPYHLSRVQEHGRRRAAEMGECADMMDAMGLDSDLTRAIARKHINVADLYAQTDRGTKT